MKKLVINLVLIFIAFILYFLQMNFFNWFTIAGVMPSLFVIFILFIGLFASKTLGTVYGIIIGLLLDFFIGKTIGVNAVVLGLIGFLAAIFDKNFSKDSRITIMLMVLGSTIIYELLCYLLSYMIDGNTAEVLYFIRILVIEVIYNLIIAIIMYPLLQKFGYYMENEYKGNKILTRYF